MAKVFISHSSSDRAFVESSLVPVLQRAGLETWYSQDDIRASQNWERSILKGLESCDWFLVVMSSAAAASPWVKAEVHWALGNRRTQFVPVMIEECNPLDFDLRMPQIQYVDYRRASPSADSFLLQSFRSAGIDSEAIRIRSMPAKITSLTAPRSHFHCGPWVPAEFFIGREEELAEARELIDSRQSFLIIGYPRAGKTSLCHKLRKQYEDEGRNDLLLSYLNLQQCSELTLETFLEHTILNIAGEIARTVFGCRYTDLKRPNPAEANPELARDACFTTFVDIFKHVSQRTHEQSGRRPQPLVTHEFVHLTTDLLHVAAQRGRSRCVIFYDEANRLPIDISGNLLLSIGEAIGETGVTGVYVASPEMEDRFNQLDQLFGGRLTIGPFRSISDMKRLLARYYFNDADRGDDLPVTEAAMQQLWTASGGVPFLIQLIADRSFRIARRMNGEVVLPSHIDQAHVDMRHERPAAFAENLR